MRHFELGLDVVRVRGWGIVCWKSEECNLLLLRHCECCVIGFGGLGARGWGSCGV